MTTTLTITLPAVASDDVWGNQVNAILLTMINAINSVITGASPAPTTDPPSAAPTLSGTVSDGSVSLTWTTLSDADSYRITVDGHPGAALPGTATTLGGLTNGRVYTFTVQGLKNGAAGPASAPLPLTPTGSVVTLPSGVLHATTDEAQNSGSAPTLSLAWGFGAPAVGNLLVAVGAGNSTSASILSMTSAGWTKVVSANAYLSVNVWQKIAVASEPAVVVALDAPGTICLQLLEVDKTVATKVDQYASYGDGSLVSSINTGVTALTNAPDLVLTAYAVDSTTANPFTTFSYGYTAIAVEGKNSGLGASWLATAGGQTSAPGQSGGIVNLDKGYTGPVGVVVAFNKTGPSTSTGGGGGAGGTVGTGSTGANPIGSSTRSGLPWHSAVYPTGLGDGNYVSRVQSFENGRGKLCDLAEGSVPNDDWAHLTQGLYPFGAYDGFQGMLAISVPMVPQGVGMPDAAHAHDYDSYWRTFGQSMIDKGRAKSVLRLGWEFSGYWYPWNARYPSNWIPYWRSIVEAVKSTNPQAIFCWNGGQGPCIGDGPSDPLGSLNQFTQIYPGDGWVDMVGFDFYDMGQGHATNDAEWNNVLRTGGMGLDDWIDFGKAHGKKVCIPEWGLEVNDGQYNKGGDNPYWITKTLNWIRANAADIGFESYFNEADSYIANSLFDPQQMPNGAAAYKAGLHG